MRLRKALARVDHLKFQRKKLRQWRLLVGRHLVGVWIGGVWSGHFSESEKYFSEAEVSRKIPEIPQKERIFAKFQAPNFENSEPEPMQCPTIPPATPYPHQTPSYRCGGGIPHWAAKFAHSFPEFLICLLFRDPGTTTKYSMPPAIPYPHSLLAASLLSLNFRHCVGCGSHAARMRLGCGSDLATLIISWDKIIPPREKWADFLSEGKFSL